MGQKNIRVCITCSSGGHWVEAHRATENMDYDRFYITYFNQRLERESEKKKLYFVVHNKKNPLLFLVNLLQSFFILKKENPDFIVSTGADVTVPVCIAGKFLGKKIIYIESGGNVYTPTLTGRIMYLFADLFIIQWEPLKKNFPKAIIGGPLL